MLNLWASGGRNKVERTHGGDLGVGVIELCLEILCGLLYVEEEYVAVLRGNRSVGVDDFGRFIATKVVLIHGDRVGLTCLAGGTSDLARFSVDREVEQFES